MTGHLVSPACTDLWLPTISFLRHPQLFTAARGDLRRALAWETWIRSFQAFGSFCLVDENNRLGHGELSCLSLDVNWVWERHNRGTAPEQRALSTLVSTPRGPGLYRLVWPALVMGEFCSGVPRGMSDISSMKSLPKGATLSFRSELDLPPSRAHSLASPDACGLFEPRILPNRSRHDSRQLNLPFETC